MSQGAYTIILFKNINKITKTLFMVRIFMNQMLIDNVRILWITIIQANKEQSYRFKKEWTQNNIITTSKIIQIVSRYLSMFYPIALYCMKKIITRFQ